MYGSYLFYNINFGSNALQHNKGKHGSVSVNASLLERKSGLEEVQYWLTANLFICIPSSFTSLLCSRKREG